MTSPAELVAVTNRLLEQLKSKLVSPNSVDSFRLLTHILYFRRSGGIKRTPLADMIGKHRDWLNPRVKAIETESGKTWIEDRHTDPAEVSTLFNTIWKVGVRGEYPAPLSIEDCLNILEKIYEISPPLTDKAVAEVVVALDAKSVKAPSKTTPEPVIENPVGIQYYPSIPEAALPKIVKEVFPKTPEGLAKRYPESTVPSTNGLVCVLLKKRGVTLEVALVPESQFRLYLLGTEVEPYFNKQIDAVEVVPFKRHPTPALLGRYIESKGRS